MLNKLKSPVTIVSALAFIAMVVVFIAHFQLVDEQRVVTKSKPVTERPAIDVAALPADPVVETTGPAETTAADTPVTPEPPRVVSYEEAEAAYLDGRYKEAVELFTVYTERKTENPWGFYMLGLSAWKAGDIDSAEPAFERAIELDPSHVKSYINLGRALLDAGRPTYALVRFHEAIALDPQSGAAHRLEGVVLHDIGKRDEAIAAYRTAIEIDNDDAWAMNNLALVLIEEGRYDEALRALARATTICDDEAVFYNNLGMALELNGRFVQATDAYDRAVTLDGGYTRAIENYNRVATVLEDPTLAPVDLAAVAADFAAEVAAWDDTVVASGEGAPQAVTVTADATPADSTAAGEGQ
jgi:Flp pilus assembly protein TadD